MATRKSVVCKTCGHRFLTTRTALAHANSSGHRSGFKSGGEVKERRKGVVGIMAYVGKKK